MFAVTLGFAPPVEANSSFTVVELPFFTKAEQVDIPNVHTKTNYTRLATDNLLSYLFCSLAILKLTDFTT